MSDFDINPDDGARTHGQPGDESHLCSFSTNGETVLYDVTNSDRWIQSDTTVSLTEVV